MGEGTVREETEADGKVRERNARKRKTPSVNDVKPGSSVFPTTKFLPPPPSPTENP